MPLPVFKNRCCLFDITIPYEKYKEGIPTHLVLSPILSNLFKQFCFQKEETPDGYVHWQVRGSLHNKVNQSTFYRDIVPQCPGNWSLTSTGTHNAGNQFSYVMKADTRIEGPWSDKDCPRAPPEYTDQLRNFDKVTRYPWQDSLIQLAQTYNERHINYIYDPHYNSGKSIMCEWLEYHALGEEIPPTPLMEDIIQFVMCMPVAKCYLFDMPAALPKKFMQQMYAGLEMLKNGFLYDKRHHGTKKRISRPALILFANTLPIYGLMAPDRYITWYITPDKRLIRYDSTIHPFGDGSLPVSMFGQFSD